MTQQDQTNHVATQRGRAAIYTKAASGARLQSTQPQTATLIALANEQGFSNERIIVYVDVYAQAKRPFAGRGALSDLLTAIMLERQAPEQEPIKAIYVSSEERLFRDANAI